VRGIYHNTLYARWWEGELQSGAARNNSWDVIPYVRAAISARYLMENNMHHLLAHDDYLPFQIWYPHPPDEMTLRELLALRPQMKHPVAHACMAGGYRTLWDELDIQPDKALREHARDCPNTYFRDEIERRIAAHQASARGSDGSNVKAWSSPPTDPRAQAFAGFQFEGSADVVVEGLTSRVVDTDWRAGPYDGLAVEAQMVALYVCAPEWLKRYAFLKDAGPVNILYWKSEDEMHKELEEDGDRDLSRKIKELSMQ
jgi:hypothetical protein